MAEKILQIRGEVSKVAELAPENFLAANPAQVVEKSARKVHWFRKFRGRSELEMGVVL